MAERYSYLQRVSLPKGKQTELINLVIKRSNLKTSDMAKSLKIHIRTLSDWRREKYTMSLPALRVVCKKLGTKMPHYARIKEPFWYTKLGAKKGWATVLKKYGRVPVNEEYRKEKWHEWWNKKGKFNENKYFVTRDIKEPKQDHHFAEFVGILLGDGCITKRQVSITLNKYDDKEYAHYISGLSRKLFGIAPSFYNQGSVWDLTISRTELVKFLICNGLFIGSKVRQQLGVPQWIQENDKLSKYCIRGLIDTDGSFYTEKHPHKNKVYCNCVINFTNRSIPLLKFVKTKLEKFGFNPRKGNQYNVCLGKEEQVSRYFKEIGSSNPKHYNKHRKFMKEKYGGVPKWS